MHKEILLKALAVRNGAVVSFSPVLTQCLGCNTAAILLGSEEQARAALFYLVKYMNKDSVPLGNSLPVIRQALLHVNRYPSRAADADTDSRTGKYFLERIVNGFTGLAEISDTQSAACLLGMKSYVSTESHWFMYIKGAEAYQHELQLQKEGVRDPQQAWEVDSDFEAEHDGEADQNEADILGVLDQLNTGEHFQEMLGQDSSRGRNRFGTAQIFKVNGEPVAVPQHVHYRFRGNELARLNFYEWCGIVNVQPADLSDSGELSSRTNAVEWVAAGTSGIPRTCAVRRMELFCLQRGIH